MSDGHFRSLQSCNGQYLLQKSASKKVLHFEKSRLKIPLVMGCPRLPGLKLKKKRDFPSL